MVGSTGSDQAAPVAAAPGTRYLPAIDGLRAVAVVAVILFHADVGPTGGGFLGVSGDEAEALAARRDASYAALSRLRSELEHPDAGG